MERRIERLMRRMAPVLAAGMLLQAGGCSVDFANLTAGLLTSVVSSVITNFVFGVFNLPVI